LYQAFTKAHNGKEVWWKAAEKAALAAYQGVTWYTPINIALWSGSSANTDSKIRNYVYNLDTVMAKSGSPVDMTVTKAQGKGTRLWHQMAEIQEGASWSPLGFDSGRVASPKNTWGGGNVRVHYQVPGGVIGTGVHYKSLPESKFDEAEFLISSNTKGKVTKKTINEKGDIEVVMAFDGFRGVIPGQWEKNYPLVNP